MLAIHEEGFYLELGKKLLLNSGHEQFIRSLCASIEYIKCSTLMQLVFPRFIRASISLDPCVTNSDPFFGPIIDKGPETMSLCVFGGRS